MNTFIQIKKIKAQNEPFFSFRGKKKCQYNSLTYIVFIWLLLGGHLTLLWVAIDVSVHQDNISL